MRIEEVTKEKLADSPDRELRVLRLRFVQLWTKYFKGNAKTVVGSLNRSDFLSRYRLLMNEYHQRKLEYSTQDIDRAAFQKAMEIAKLGIDATSLGDIVVVPDYVSLGGSAVRDLEKANDLDIIVREKEDNRDPGLELKLARTLDAQEALSKKDKEFVYSARGPHSTHIPLFDLVLRAKRETQTIEVEENYAKSDYYDGLDTWTPDFEADYRELTKHLMGDTVLSLGCGTGRLEKRLASIYQVEGIDNNDTALRMCREKNLTVQKVDLEKGTLPYGDNAFDNVIAVHVLEHLENTKSVIDEALRVAKRRAVFIVPLGSRQDVTHKQTFQDMEDFRKQVVSGLSLPGKKIKLHKVRNGDNTAVLVLKATGRGVSKKGLKPFGRYTPPKPEMANLTEAFKFEDISGWIQSRWPVAVEEKLNGFRCIAEKSGEKFRIWTEGKKDRTEAFAPLTEVLSQVKEDFILDFNVGIDKAGKPLPRIKLMTLMADRPELEEDEQIKATCFDLPYFGDDIHEKPLKERREKLDAFYDRYLKSSPAFALTHFVTAGNRQKLEAAFEKLSELPQSEGVVIKSLDSAWDTDGSAEDWSKIKLEAEIKVIVFDRNATKVKDGSTYNYHCGVLLGDADYTNTITYKDNIYVDFGNTYNTKIKAEPGDILTVGVEEIIPDEDKKRLQWLGPRVLDVDKDRKEPYYAKQVVDIARRGHVLQKAKESANIDYEVGDTGKGVLQLHIMGIEPERIDDLKRVAKEAYASRHNYRKLRMLLKGAIGEQAAHLDLRLARDGDTYFEGGEIMIGNLTGLGKLDNFLDKPNTKLRFGWKTPHAEEPTAETIRGPVSWMEAGTRRLEIFEPGEVGAFANTYGAMLALDEFDFTMVQADEHAKKIEFAGGKLLKDGIYLFAYVPVDQGRVWMISRLPPNEQKFEKFVPVFVQKAEEQIVCGIVYEPDEVDAQGDTADAEEIRKAAYQFMEEVQAFKVNHEGRPVKARVLESYVAPDDLTIAGHRVKKGSWLLTTRILDKNVWEDIKSGKLTGYSMAGYAMAG